MLAENGRRCGVPEEAQQVRGEDPGDLAGALLRGDMLGG
jgi:hypothetical protein